jgi:PKD repeat protein
MVSANIELYKSGETGQSGESGLYMDVVPVTFQFKIAVISGTPTSFLWDFGDGSTSNIREPTHTYDFYGHYPVVLTVSDGLDTDTTMFDIYLGKLDFEGTPIKGLKPLTVQFRNKSVSPIGASFTGYQWEFGDGVTGMINDPTHVYPNVGKYTVKLNAVLTNI